LIWARAEGSRVWDADGREFLVVDAWDFGEEDLYTHMHSGNPLACAAGLVVLGGAEAALGHRCFVRAFCRCWVARQGPVTNSAEERC